jgi:hypothetical protein
LGGLQTIHAGHHFVDENQVKVAFSIERQSVFAASAELTGMAQLARKGADNEANQRIIVNGEDV